MGQCLTFIPPCHPPHYRVWYIEGLRKREDGVRVLLKPTWVQSPTMKQNQSTDTRLFEEKVQQGANCGDPIKENGQLMLKRPRLPDGFQGRTFKGNICGEGCSVWTFLWLVDGQVTGWCFWDLNHQPSGSRQSSVYLLVVHVVTILHPWTRGWGFLVSAENSKICTDCCTYQLRRNQDSVLWTESTNFCLRHHYFPCSTAPPLSLHPLTSLISNCWRLFFGTPRRPKRLKLFSTNKKWGT